MKSLIQINVTKAWPLANINRRSSQNRNLGVRWKLNISSSSFQSKVNQKALIKSFFTPFPETKGESSLWQCLNKPFEEISHIIRKAEDFWRENFFRGLHKNFTTPSEQWKLWLSNPWHFIPPCSFVVCVTVEYTAFLWSFYRLCDLQLYKSVLTNEKEEKWRNISKQMRL